MWQIVGEDVDGYRTNRCVELDAHDMWAKARASDIVPGASAHREVIGEGY